MAERLSQLTGWVASQLMLLACRPLKLPVVLEPVSGDASFRRYFRVFLEQGSLIVMDAPPDKENSVPFVAIAQHWRSHGVPVPQIMAQDLQKGFLLLTDFGDSVYLGQLGEETADRLYQQALEALLQIQQCPASPDYPLPPYDAAKLQAEMHLCPQWFFSKLLAMDLTDSELGMLEQVFAMLVKSALEQPQVNVHRDFHSRNLMLPPGGDIGVLDFQDAVYGPITYDLVSLLRDCYINWLPQQEIHWIETYVDQARIAGLISARVSREQFIRWFDWMGLQRHIKCVGIFSRLCLRDGKAGYLRDIPRTFGYIKRVCAHYPQLAEFNDWLEVKVIPHMQQSKRLPAWADEHGVT